MTWESTQPKLPEAPSTSTHGSPTTTYDLFDEPMVHTASREILDPSYLRITGKQRSRFSRAMKRLGIKPKYHLSELEPHIIHPMKDKGLAGLCSCREMDCPGEAPDLHSYERPACLEYTIQLKSKGM